MVVIRPTLNLTHRMGIKKLSETDCTSTTVLGDWYATGVVLVKKQFILCVCEHARLAILVEAAPYRTFYERLSLALSKLLRDIGVPYEKIQTELSAMESMQLAKSVNRSVLGTLKEYKKQLQYMQHYKRLDLVDIDLQKLSLHLSDIPSLVMDDVWPITAAAKLFGVPAPLKLRIV